MALVPLRLEVEGDVLYSRAFNVAAQQAEDLREPLQEVGNALLAAVGRQFLTEGSSELGSRWQPLSPAYAAWKEANYPGRPILVRSGEMRSAALSRDALNIDRRRLTYTVETPYAIYHQRGEGVPKRPIVALSSATRRQIDRIFVEWVSGIYSGPLWRAR